MTDRQKLNPVLIAGRMITFYRPEQGQMEMLFRVQRAISRGADDSVSDFLAKQLDRLGTLLESLLTPAEADIVENLLLTGKTDTVTVFRAFTAALTETDAPKVAETAVKAAPKKAVKRA